MRTGCGVKGVGCRAPPPHTPDPTPYTRPQQGFERPLDITDRSPDRPDGVQALRQRYHAAGGNQAVGRLEPDRSAQRRGDADRSRGIGAERHVEHAGGHGRRRAAARAAGGERGVPGVPRRAVVRVVVGGAERELVGVRLPHQHRAGLAQRPHHGRVARRHPLAQDPRARRGARALRGDQVLDGDGDAVQGAASLPAPDLLFGLARLRPRARGGDRDEGVEHGLRALDGGECVFDVLGDGGRGHAQW